MSEEKRRKVTTITGTVTHANERGVRLDDGEQWYNASKYAKPAVLMPAKGSRVTLTVDDLSFVYKVEPAGDAPAPSGDRAAAAPQSAAPTQSGYERHDRLVCREWAVNAAIAARAAGAVNYPADIDDVMALAERLAAWAQGDAPWTPEKPAEPPRKPAHIAGVSKGVPQAVRAPAPGSAPAAAIPAAVEDTPEPPDSEYGPEGAPGQRPAFEPPPREPVMPEVEPQEDDANTATQAQIQAIGGRAGRLGYAAAYVKALMHYHFGKQLRAELTQGEARRLLHFLTERLEEVGGME